MRSFVLAMAIAMAGLLGRSLAADAPKQPSPQKEHEALKKFAGEWITEGEMIMDPNKPPVKGKGTETCTIFGGFWLKCDVNSDVDGAAMRGQWTLGYDSTKKKYVGSWVCNMCDIMYNSEGTMEGDKLVMLCEGPNPETGKIAKMKDVIELKDKDTKVLTSYIQDEKGNWKKIMTMTSRRKQ